MSNLETSHVKASYVEQCLDDFDTSFHLFYEGSTPVLVIITPTGPIRITDFPHFPVNIRDEFSLTYFGESGNFIIVTAPPDDLENIKLNICVENQYI